MSVVHYRLSTALAASLSLLLAACGTSPPAASTASAADAKGQPAAAKESDGMDTEATLWTVLGLAKKGSYKPPGPQTGSTVSPILYQAALDTLDFTTFASKDPLGGSLVTDWYSPPDKPNERFRIDVFILSRYLTSDGVAVTVTRQVRGPNGQWTNGTVDRKVDDELETRILYRARQLRNKWIHESKS
jgi:Domain of unknown function (DUF3576)